MKDRRALLWLKVAFYFILSVIRSQGRFSPIRAHFVPSNFILRFYIVIVCLVISNLHKAIVLFTVFSIRHFYWFLLVIVFFCIALNINRSTSSICLAYIILLGTQIIAQVIVIDFRIRMVESFCDLVVRLAVSNDRIYLWQLIVQYLGTGELFSFKSGVAWLEMLCLDSWFS